MNIKPGKWKSVCGECVTVELYSQTGYWVGYRMEGENIWMAPLLWIVTGNCYSSVTGNKEPKYDLVEPWTDKPVVNWSAIPAWAKWVAMDENRDWFWYEQSPVRGDDKWIADIACKYWGIVHPKFAPSFTGNWRDSLAERPTA